VSFESNGREMVAVILEDLRTKGRSILLGSKSPLVSESSRKDWHKDGVEGSMDSGDFRVGFCSAFFSK
jgi:hypothetical protein